MWQRRKQRISQKRIDSLIGVGTVVTGDVVFAGGLRVDGHIRGNIVATDGETGTLVVSEQARIDGEIHVTHAVINGTVNGPIATSEHLELQSKARVAGDVSYRSVEMHIGAVIQGRLQHAEPSTADVVELKRAGSG